MWFKDVRVKDITHDNIEEAAKWFRGELVYLKRTKDSAEAGKPTIMVRTARGNITITVGDKIQMDTNNVVTILREKELKFIGYIPAPKHHVSKKDIGNFRKVAEATFGKYENESDDS